MAIVLCVKAVPDPEDIKFDKKEGRIVREKGTLILNPPDRHAAEIALSLKEKTGKKVIALSMGPPQAEKILKEIYSLGADELILLSDRVFAGSDALATGYILSQAIKQIKDLSFVVMGEKSIDGETGILPGILSAMLRLPLISGVREILYVSKERGLFLREQERFLEEVEVSGKAVISVKSNLEYLRPPSLKRLLKVEEVKVSVWNKEQIKADEKKVGFSGSPSKVISVFEEETLKRGEIIKEAEEKLCLKLIETLKKKGFLRGNQWK